MQTTQAKQTLSPKMQEQILVVKRTVLFEHEAAWNGLKKVDFKNYLKLIDTHKEFHPRGFMEEDPTFKQIIPYLVFCHNDRYFLMERHKKASETRLQSKMSLGIGGHIRKEDITSQDLFDWAKREFHEEVHYKGTLEIEPLGILNDDSNDVGKVHIGFVLLLKGDTDQISVKSELASGKMVSLEECKQAYDRMETWSQFVVDSLSP